MLYNEKNIAKSLRTPFVNLQKQAYDEDWSLTKLNINTEKVYSYLSSGKKKQVFHCWKVWTKKKKILNKNFEVVQEIQNFRMKKDYFNFMVDVEYQRKQARMVNSYMVCLFCVIV